MIKPLLKPSQQPRKRKKNHSLRDRTRSNARMKLDLDAICKKEVMERDGYQCQRCGSVRDLQWSHVHSRRHNCLRWDANNTKILCKSCHFWWTNNPGLAIDWFQKNWPERWRTITDLLIVNPKVNVKELWEARENGD